PRAPAAARLGSPRARRPARTAHPPGGRGPRAHAGDHADRPRDRGGNPRSAAGRGGRRRDQAVQRPDPDAARAPRDQPLSHAMVSTRVVVIVLALEGAALAVGLGLLAGHGAWVAARGRRL